MRTDSAHDGGSSSVSMTACSAPACRAFEVPAPGFLEPEPEEDEHEARDHEHEEGHAPAELLREDAAEERPDDDADRVRDPVDAVTFVRDSSG